ncbi:hypothetical protein SEA_SHAGRAT_49 [Rhodococcus phage Shagrat]|nr:hypothetical protein SEA_SHAGRAT_49 [Rhodococcus phage Shagrat]
MNTSQICSNTRALIARDGWAQKSQHPGKCIVEALFVTAPDFDTFLAASRAIKETLGVDRTFRLDHWNDAPERTKGEVLDVLQRTAIRLDESHAALYRGVPV